MQIKLNTKNSVKDNQDVLNHVLWESKEVKKLRESFKKHVKGDLKEMGAPGSAFPIMTYGFDWNKVATKFGTSVREADSGSGFTQVLRAGVQLVVNSMYQTVKTTFEDWVHVVPSSKDTELYAPLHGISFLKEVAKQEKYGEAHAAGLDIKLKNRKYGEMYPIEMELLEDDQTGQFQKQAGLMGEYAKLALEAICYAKLASVANMSYAGLTIPQSETQPTEESTYPWSTALVGGGKNRPASYGAPTQANIQAGYVGLMNQLNKLGLKMSVDGNRLIASPFYRFDLSTLLNSSYWPAVPSATAGATGGAFSENPMKGLANLTISRFVFDQNGANLNSKAWYLIDDSKPWFVLQVRESASVSQENPQAGDSFDRDVIRFKVRLRCNADHIDPRFAWQGSDGSV